MWELDYKESWMPKNWCFWTVVLEKTLENPLDCKEIQPVQPKGDRSWIFIGRTDVEAETPLVSILWPPDAKNWLIDKTLMLVKIEGRRRRGRQRCDGWLASLTWWTLVWVSSGSWWWTGKPGKESDTTERLNLLKTQILPSNLWNGWERYKKVKTPDTEQLFT